MPRWRMPKKKPRKMLEVYRSFAEDVLAMPVIAGEKPENERFPGAVNTYSIEAMMQDGKALQAGTSHFLGTHFAEAQNIKFQNDAGAVDFCNTTSWGVSTRLIGGVIMTHGDDDGLGFPRPSPRKQIVVVPMLRDKPEDAEVLSYCENLVKALGGMTAFGQPVRALLDKKPIKSAEKRWNWVRRGAPLIVEVGPRDAAGGNVTYMRRDDLRDGDKVKSIVKPRGGFCRRRGATADRNPGRAACGGQGAAGRQYRARHRRFRRPSPPISARMTTASKAGCGAPWAKADRRGAGSGGRETQSA